ncbi:hypothetical protein [Gaetbulibacter sp. PBL-D1]|uniref:hypothetical protein n=1 Tax=Gaetbulibacter sp. PBL-D1 TaxID=3422594 RepID=UPI003D2EA32C
MVLKHILLTFSFFLISLNHLQAQSLPKVTTQDYGFLQPVNIVETVSYNLDKEPIEKSTYRFSKDGFIDNYHIQNLKDNTWSTSKCIYKKGKLHKRIFEFSNSKENRKHTYKYNGEGQLVEETIKLKNGSSHNTFSYQNGLLYQTTSIENNTVTTYYYSNKGKLYKAIRTQKNENQREITTNYYYLEGKEITSYVSPEQRFEVTSYLENFILKFDLSDNENATERLMKGMQRFDKEAPLDNLPFNLEQYSNQTTQFYGKHKDKLTLTQVLLFDYKTDAQGNKIAYAEADIDLNTNTIAGIRFYKTTLSNGEVIGNTKYDDEVQAKFEDMLSAINSF